MCPEVAITDPGREAAALSASVEPPPVAQSMPSWQAPQALRLGLSHALLALTAWLLSWQVAHILCPLSSIEKPLLLKATLA